MIKMIVVINKNRCTALWLSNFGGLDCSFKKNKEAIAGNVSIKSCRRVAPINPKNKAPPNRWNRFLEFLKWRRASSPKSRKHKAGAWFMP